MNPDIDPQSKEPGEIEDYRVRAFPTVAEVRRRIVEWLRAQVPLSEAFCVAVSFHILAFPVIWFIGWALPWPKPPIKTVVIEFNLENWPNEATPEKIEEIFNKKLSEIRRR